LSEILAFIISECFRATDIPTVTVVRRKLNQGSGCSLNGYVQNSLAFIDAVEHENCSYIKGLALHESMIGNIKSTVAEWISHIRLSIES